MSEEKPPTCRVCLEATDEAEKVVSLFEVLGSSQVCEHIMSVAAVSIALDDGLPACICAACLLELQTALEFRSKCEASDRSLRSSQKARLGDSCAGIKNELESGDEFPIDEFLENFPHHEPCSDTTKKLGKPRSDVQCHDCQKLFKSKCKLRVHWKKEHLLRRFICPTCKRLFKSQFAFSRHRRAPARSCRDLIDCDSVRVEGEGKSRMFQCVRCEYKVHRWIHMRQHIVIHTPWEKPFKCNLCPCAYSQGGTLKHHKASCHGEVTEKAECHICGKVFPTRRNLYRHFLKHQEAKVPCPLCGILVKTNSSLKIHMKRHSGTKSYTCEQCAAAFYSSAELTNHRRIQHTERQFFKCELCDYRSPRKTRLLKHEAGHTGDVQVPCIKCGKFYETTHHLEVHLAKYHKPKRYKCPICPAMFVSRKSTTRHFKEIHGHQVSESQPVIDTSTATMGSLRLAAPDRVS